MDIESIADILLSDAGYRTQRWLTKTSSLLLFEDDSVLGFLHTFNTAQTLLNNWHSQEQGVLATFAPALRSSGAKAWNVYSVFLTDEVASANDDRAILRLDENLQLTRKIARAGITTQATLRNALYPLMPIGSRPSPEPGNYVDRLRQRLYIDLDPSLVDAFLGTADGDDLLRLMIDAR